MPLTISRIKAICFDIDGTLRDTDDHYAARVARMLHPIRWLLPQRNPEASARRLVMGFEGPVNGLFALADRLGLDGLLHRFVELASPSRRRGEGQPYTLIPGIRSALAALAQHYPLAAVTTRGATSTQHFLESTQLASQFQCVASALTTRRGKPSPEPILWAAQLMEIAPEACLMVGDTTVDIRAGKAAGAQTVALLSGFGEEAELLALSPDLVLPSVAELPAALGLA